MFRFTTMATRVVTLVGLANCGCGARATQPSPSIDDRAVPTTAVITAKPPPELARTEFVMSPGETITATTPVGTISIHADDWLKRSYTWDGATRSIRMWPRDERWYGSLGIYFPGPIRNFPPHEGITRAVVNEGQQHFSSVADAVRWIHDQDRLELMPHVYTPDGLVVGWKKVLLREQLSVNVWQVLVNGRKPADLPGACPSVIRVTR